MYSSQIVAERIKKAVKANNTTMDKLNTECNISKNAISSASKSSEGMKAKNLYMIAEFLGVSVDYLLGRTDDFHRSINNSYNQNGNNNFQTFGGMVELSKRDAELLQKVNSLDFSDYADIINYINEKLKNKG